MCDCIKIEIEANSDTQVITYQLQAGGELNGFKWFTWTHGGITYFMWYENNFWFVSSVLGSLVSGIVYSRYAFSGACPIASLTGDPATGWTDIQSIWKTMTSSAQACPKCNQQDRTKKTFSSIKLPQDFIEENRGVKECCCKFLVLASPSSDTWKSDTTSAWIKTSDPSDTFDFKLYKNGVITSYNPTENQFPADSLAYYTTIKWIDVLNSDGLGCYELKISYSISGISGELSWGNYELQRYSIQNALHTARVRAIFNGIQEVQDINFTGAEVESSFRFHGYIGNRQPNMETDNIIFNNREMKRVTRENLNTYEIITDPSDDCIIKPLVELFLLSENELFISDYNASNPRYDYQDLPVIVSESPSLEYYDQSRKVKLTAVVSDKFKNKRTFY